MQRLEVSGAVRPIYGSLGVKRLKSLWITNVYKQVRNIKYLGCGISCENGKDNEQNLTKFF